MLIRSFIFPREGYQVNLFFPVSAEMCLFFEVVHLQYEWKTDLQITVQANCILKLSKDGICQEGIFSSVLIKSPKRSDQLKKPH